MGWGDEVIASGQARLLHEQTGARVLIFDAANRWRAHPAWNNNPHIWQNGDRIYGRTKMMRNGPGLRPYILDKVGDTKWVWRNWACTVGELYFDKFETTFADNNMKTPMVVVEPNNKARASPNKDWGRQRWQELVNMLRAAGIKPVQLGPAGTQLLQGVEFIETPNMRLACAVLGRARAAVLPEGGLHHSAAALKVPSVVIFGGFISPKQTGYAKQTNLFTGGEPCGMRTPCKHCADAMAKITPAMVFEKTMELLNR